MLITIHGTWLQKVRAVSGKCVVRFHPPEVKSSACRAQHLRHGWSADERSAFSLKISLLEHYRLEFCKVHMKDMKISLNTRLILSETSAGQIFHLIWNSLFDIAQYNRQNITAFNRLWIPLAIYGSWFGYKKIPAIVKVKRLLCCCELDKGLSSSSVTHNPFFTWYGAREL